MVQISQDKVWVWGDCRPSAIIDCQMVQPALNPFLADVPGIQGINGAEMLQVDCPMLRELPYSEPKFLWLLCAQKVEEH